MENVRIAVLSSYDRVCAFLDNDAPKALHYYDDELHEYLKGSAYTYTFTACADHEDAQYLTEGNKIAFVYKGKDYYLNIMRVDRDEYEVTIEAFGLLFELLNEQKEKYSAASAMTAAEYLDIIDYEHTIKLGLNEVSDKRIKYEWTGTDTILARIYSLATVFGAEAEFVAELNDDYSLKQIVLNLYREHTDTIQGIGARRKDVTLRYGVNVSGIRKIAEITDLYTAIRPFGRDGLTVTSLDKKEYDSNGVLEFDSPKGNRNILAPQARDRYPSNLRGGENDRYIAKIWEYDTDNVNMLYGQALAELKKLCVPQVKYEVSGYFDTDIGDTVIIEDEGYDPVLYLEARVTEQLISFTDKTRNKTTFSNFRELQSDIDPELLARMKTLVDENKTYTCTIVTDNGIVFKNGKGSTTLTACVRSGAVDVTDDFSIRWFKDGQVAAEGRSVTVAAGNVGEKAAFRFEADDGVNVVGQYEVTLSCVYDGEDGPAGKDGDPGKDGRGIAGTEVAYQASESGSIIPTGAWLELPPETAAGRYLWTRVVITYTDDTTSASYSVVRNGTDGVNGTNGVDGQMLYASCASAAGTAAKVASLTAGRLQLTPGTTVAVQFTAENTATNPTLNIDGTGAKAIYVQGSRSVYWAAGATVTFTYDGANWRVASEPVYANEAVVGNRAFRNVYLGSSGMDLRNGSKVLASFRDDLISLGVSGEVASILMLAGQLIVGAVSGIGTYIKGSPIQIGVKGLGEAGYTSSPHLYIDNDGVYATNRSGGYRGRILTENDNKANVGSRELLWSGSLAKGGAVQLPNANWSRYNLFMARTSDGTTILLGGRFDNAGLAYIRFAGGYDDGSSSLMFKGNATINLSNNVLTNVSFSKHKYVTTALNGSAANVNLVALWGII